MQTGPEHRRFEMTKVGKKSRRRKPKVEGWCELRGRAINVPGGKVSRHVVASV